MNVFIAACLQSPSCEATPDLRLDALTSTMENFALFGEPDNTYEY
jgi:hypothetical protein